MIKALIVLTAISIASTASADRPPELAATMQEKGSTQTTLLGVSLYKGTLYTSNGQPFQFNGEFALTLDYLRDFKASTLAKATIKEMERIGGSTPPDADKLLVKLTNCFANVRAGDRITGVAQSKNQVRFYFNGQKRCDLKAKNISKQFFEIWLGDNTRDAKGTARLKGTS